jgi:RHS repeat-associated protein
MLMPGRKYSSGNYRYGFNGKEEDDEVKGDGNSLDFGARIYDSRLVRFLSVDPKIAKFPWKTPYQFAGNNPILYVDHNGEEEKEYLLVICIDGSTRLTMTYYNKNKFRAFDYTRIKVQFEGGTATATYFFSPWGTNGDPLAPSGGGHNHLDQVNTFLKDPLQAMLSANFTTEEEILKETFQEIALSIIVGRIIRSGSKQTLPRLKQDEALGKNKKAPPALATNGRTIGDNPNQNKAVQDRVTELKKKGATDIRIDQQQVDADGNHVGINRPDLQYTLDGKRFYVEWDTPSSGRGAGHKARIQANDPKAGGVELIILK